MAVQYLDGAATNVATPVAPTTPAPAQPAAPTAAAPQSGALDPKLVTLAQSIRQVESGGNFQARGASGEYGAYQFMPTTWEATAPRYGVNVPLQQATPEQQNEVAYKQLEEWARQHPSWNIGNFASAWNAGPGKPDAYLEGNAGTNAQGVQYDTAAYVKRVGETYQQLKAQNNTISAPPSPQGGFSPDAPPSIGGFLGNTIASGANFLGNLGNAALHPIQTVQNIGGAAVGGLQELGGQQNDNTARFDALKNYFADRYKSPDALFHTIYTDPVGFAADLSTVLGVGGGAVGLAGKAADVAGLSGVADTAGSVASGLGRASVLTNPLTPVVAGAGALLNKSKSLSDVIANPNNYTQEEIAKSSSDAITKDVQSAFEEHRSLLSETGSGYAPFRDTPVPIVTEPAQLDSILRDTLKVNVTDGVIAPNSTSLLRDTPSISKLQSVYNTYKPDFLQGTMDSEKLLNLRSDLAKIAYNDLGMKNSDVAALAAKVRAAVNDTFRPQIPGLSELDSSYSSQLQNLNELEDGLIYKSGPNRGELKTSFINTATKAVKNADAEKLAQLEQLLPGIIKRLQVMKTIKDLGHPSFTTSLVEKGGVAGGLITGNIQGAALALTSIILSQPAIALPLLRAIGANLELVKAVMANLAKSLTVGAVSKNVQDTTQQTPPEQSATVQSPDTTPLPTGQIENPSPNATTNQ